MGRQLLWHGTQMLVFPKKYEASQRTEYKKATTASAKEERATILAVEGTRSQILPCLFPP